jgi:hypothetical protein
MALSTRSAYSMLNETTRSAVAFLDAEPGAAAGPPA